MANELPLGTLARARTGGNDLNGAGYKSGYSGSTDYSNQDSPQLSLTDLECVASSTTLTSVTGGFTAAMVGNCIRIQAGSGGWVSAGYETFLIVAYTNTNTVTLDRTAATGTNGTGGSGRVGGAIKTFKRALALCSAGANVSFADGTYSETSALTGGDATGEGDATRFNKIYAENDYGATISIAVGTSAQYFNSTTLLRCEIVGFIFTTPAAGCKGMGYIGGAVFRKCKWNQFTVVDGWALIRGDGAYFKQSVWEDCVFDGTIFLGASLGVMQLYDQTVRRCVFKNHTNTIHPYIASMNGHLERCVYYNNTGATTDIVDCGNLGGNVFVSMTECVVYTVGRHVINCNTAADGNPGANISLDKCIFYGGGGKVINHSTGFTRCPYEVTCSAYGNFTGGGYDNTVIPDICFRNFFAITTDPFTAAATFDFTLNATAGGGATVMDEGMDCWDWSITAGEGAPGVDGTRAAEVPTAGVTPPDAGSDTEVQIEATYASACGWYDDGRWYLSVGGKTLCYDFSVKAWTDCGLGYVAAAEVIAQRGVMPTLTLLAANVERPVVGAFPTILSHRHQQMKWNAQGRADLPSCKIVYRCPDGAGYGRQRIKKLKRVTIWGEYKSISTDRRIGTITASTDTGATFTAPIVAGLYKDETVLVRQEWPASIQGALITITLEMNPGVWVTVRDWYPEYVPEN